MASDIESFTEDPTIFGFDVPDFTESFEVFPGFKEHREPRDHVGCLRDGIHGQATRLGGDNAKTTESVWASGEPRQAIANTRLQGSILLLSLVAAIIAVIGILIALSDGDGGTGARDRAGHRPRAGRSP